MKTELYLFYKNDTRTTELLLGGEKVTFLKDIKILGVVFDSKLN